MVEAMKVNSRKKNQNTNLIFFKYVFATALGLSVFPSVSASDFFTIIGPDGRPIVIERNKSEVESKPKQNTSTARSDSTFSSINNNSDRDVQKQQNTEIQNPESSIETNSNNQVKKVQNQVEQNEKQYEKKNYQAVKDSSKQDIAVQTSNQKISKEQAQNQRSSHIQTPKNLTNNSISAEEAKPLKNELPSKTTVIDGVEYVDSEYLEENEFNVEGRKRFYIVPDSTGSGAARFEAIERRKGITKSVLSKFLQASEPVQQKAMALSPQYMRIEQEELVQSLGQKCFTGKKIKDAKLLIKDQSELALWPTAPLKESFTFNVVELDRQVKQLHFQSYASSNKNPTYYWPLVVFLNEQGCIIEGATGFKVQKNQSDVARYSSLEGLIVKPDLAKYILLTPLAESIDTQEYKLTDSGQIRLKAKL